MESGQSCDILVDIADEDLPLLLDMYREHISWAPHVLNFFNTVIRVKKLEKFRDRITVMSPNGCWKNDGTFIALFELSSYDLFMFTLDKKCINLCDGLSNTKRIDFNRYVLFFCLYNDFIPAVEKCLAQKQIELKFDDSCFMFVTPTEVAKNFLIKCPPDVYIKDLEPSHAKQINSAWPHKYPGSEDYIQNLIEMNGGLGVFLKSTNQLIAWVVVHCLGHLGMLQTEEEYKQKGYGSLVTKALSKKLAEQGNTPFGTVFCDNEASINMMKKLGFKSIGLSTYCWNENK